MAWGGARPGAGRKAMSPEAKAERRAKAMASPKVPAEPKAMTLPSLDSIATIIEASNARKRNLERRPEINPFQLPKFPPAAMPPKTMQMAMDDSLTFASTEWAGGYMSGMAAEGLLFLGYAYLSELAQRPEYRVFSETIATEMTRKWIKFSTTGNARAKKKADEDAETDDVIGADEEPGENKDSDKKDNEKTSKIAELTDFLDDLKTRDRFCDLATQDGFFGRTHLSLNSGDVSDEELKTPIADANGKFLPGKIGRGFLRRLQVIEPVWTYPTTYNATNPLAIDWYNPQVWYVMGKQIHRSRLPTFIGRPVPDMLKPAYSFGGLSLSQMAKPYVDIWLTTRQSVGDLIHAFSVMVLMTDLQTLLQPGGAGNLLGRVALFNALRDNQGAFVVNKATEDFKNVSVPLSGLHELQAQAQEHMCLSEGTLIETDRGQVPVEKVTLKDRVMTRNGYAPIHWVGVTGRVSKFVEIETDEAVLRVTECHPIWSETIGGFVSARNVDPSHRLLALASAESTGNLSHGAGDGGGRLKLAITETRRLAVSCTEGFTRRTRGLFRKALTCIMQTRIPSIIGYPISSLSLAQTTIVSIGKPAGADGGLVTFIRSPALFAEIRSGPFYRRGRSTVPMPAKARHGSVAIRGVRILAQPEQPVYNISVADGYAPEFYANGILVHNCSVARIPAVKFTGIQPSGLNASSEGELRAFYDTIAAYQGKFFKPNLDYLIDIAQITLWGAKDPDIVYEFEPLWGLSEKEKSEMRKADAETGQIHVDTGVISPEEERRRIAGDPEGLYHDIDPEDVPDLLEEEEGGLIPEGGGAAARAAIEGDDPESPDRGGAAADAAIPFLGGGDSPTFREGDHPRAPDGKFGSGGGGGSPHEGKSGKFKSAGTGNLAAQGLKPKKKAGGSDVTGALQVAWAHAQATGAPATVTHTGRGGLTIVKPGEKIPHNQSHMVVDVDGNVTKYHPDLGGGEDPKASAPPMLKADDLKKVGDQMGSNPGGVYEDKSGKKFYVKRGKSPEHVKNELLAASLYKLAGTPTLNYRPVEGGGHVATELVPLDKKNAGQLSPDEIKKAQEDLAVHAWLANWDAVGLGGDNLGTVGGVPTALDLGGALSYRAQGAPKGQAFGNSVGELDTLRSKSMNPDAAGIFGSMSPEAVKASVAKVAAIPDSAVREAVAAAGLGTEMADKLIARKRDLAKRAGVQAQDSAWEPVDEDVDEDAVEEMRKRLEEADDQAADEFNPSDHPHAPAGSSTGGQFVSTGGTTGGSGGGEGGKFKSKKEHAAHLLTEGTTTAKMLESLGWPSISMPAMAKSLGMKLEKKKEGGVTYYKGTPMTQSELAAAKAEAKAKPAPEPAAAPAPAPASPAVDPPTESELAIAKKVTSFPTGGYTGEALKAVQWFNEKYAGKQLTDAGALTQKVADYKKLKTDVAAAITVQAAEQQKKNAAAAEAQKKANAEAAEALKKQQAAAKEKTKEYMSALGISETEAAGFDALVGMMGGDAKDVIKKFQGYESQAKNLGYEISGFQYALIRNYINGGYGEINKALRSGSWTPAQHVYARMVNNAIDKMPKYSGTVTRGATLSKEQIANYKPGHVSEERAFTSTGIDYKFGGNVHYTIKAIGKRGGDFSKGANTSEKEVLFKAHTNFLVHKVESKGGTTYIEMEEIESHG